MSFLSDILRPLGVVTTAVLAATGVGLPLAIGIGSVVTTGGNLAANAIDDSRDNAEVNQSAADQSRRAEEEIDHKRAEQEAAARNIRTNLEKQLEQTELTKSILDLCRSGNVDELPHTLQKLTNETFNELGLKPLEECTGPELQARVLDMLEAERTRRG